MTEKIETFNAQRVGLFRSTRVNSLVDVPKMNPIVEGSRLSVIMDLDGVLCGYGKDNTRDQNIAKLFALGEIVKSSSDLMFYSSRIVVEGDEWWWGLTAGLFEKQSLSHAPFFTKKSEKSLTDFINLRNRNCRVSFDVGFFNKIGGCTDGVYDLSRITLRRGLPLVMIGSNNRDEQNAQMVASVMDSEGLNVQNMYGFNTGHRLI